MASKRSKRMRVDVLGILQGAGIPCELSFVVNEGWKFVLNGITVAQGMENSFEATLRGLLDVVIRHEQHSQNKESGGT